jgi:hypothetical protein
MHQEFLRWISQPNTCSDLSKLLDQIQKGNLTELPIAPSAFHTDHNNTMLYQRKTMVGPPKRSMKPNMSRSIIHEKMRVGDVTNIKNTTKKNSIIGVYRVEELNDMSPKQLVLTVFDEYVQEKEVLIDSFFGVDPNSNQPGETNIVMNNYLTSNLKDPDTLEMTDASLKAFIKNILELPEYFGILLKQKLKKLTRPRVKAYYKQKLSLKTRNERAFELLFNNYNLSHEKDESKEIQQANFGKV